jgi:hypothetical protein
MLQLIAFIGPRRQRQMHENEEQAEPGQKNQRSPSWMKSGFFIDQTHGYNNQQPDNEYLNEFGEHHHALPPFDNLSEKLLSFGILLFYRK